MKKILVVEDNTQIRENTAEILQLAGYETYEAENGKKGVETALKQKPDLIVCDIMMPELDGYGVLHLLKKNPGTEQIPFIFLTAKAERSDFRKGMEMGADDYISKPFDDIELLKTIEIRLKKIDIIKMQYPAGEKGASDLIKDLKDSGFLALDPDQYDSERFNKRMNLYKEGKWPKFLYVIKSGGTATESLIRTLSDFKSEKLIEINDGKIKITQPDRLSDLLY